MVKRKNKKQKEIDLGHYIVAFMDLLGQQNFLRSLSIPYPETPENREETKKQLSDTYGAVIGMRKGFDDSFKAFAKRNITPAGLPPDKLREFKTLTNNPIQYQAFSDSIVISMPLTTRTAKLPIRGIYGILGATAVTFTCNLAAGHPIRGGIDIGLGIDIAKNEVYGPALSKAYNLESKVADYPRVVIGDELMRYLISSRDQPATDTATFLSKKLAKNCIECISEDDDGKLILDHLGEQYRRTYGEAVDASILKQSYENVINFSANFKTDKKLSERYRRLKKYYESRLPFWDDLITS